MHYVAAFRTYTWDEDVAELARRFFLACPQARQVVLADETRGPLGIQGYEVISHTEDTSGLGLLVYPAGNSLWHNVDYGLYILRQKLPGYDHYLTSESDLAVNTPLEGIVQAAADRDVDLVAHLVRPATADWYWYENAIELSENPLGSILYFMIVSARTVDMLFYMRRQLTVEFNAGRMRSWPFCESFVPSLMQNAGMTFADIGEFVDTENLRLRPRLLLTDERANRPGSLAHSVLGRVAYINAIIKEHPARDWFSLESEMHVALKDHALLEYADLLYDSFVRCADFENLERFKTALAVAGVEVTGACLS